MILLIYKIVAMNKIKNDVIEILKKYTFSDSVWIDFNDRFSIVGDLKINSARVVDIILDIEELYEITIDDEELSRMITVKNIVEIIGAKTGAK